ncbi:MAG: hypothetical protein FRX49_06121 [Trebouxia sp. A1-2]|nr:MAG: hypothetical protein FRX49_06121 [Trebouxia sp. A1-2]
MRSMRWKSIKRKRETGGRSIFGGNLWCCRSQPVRPPEPEILNLLCPMLESLTHNPVKTHPIENRHDGKRQIPEQALGEPHLRGAANDVYRDTSIVKGMKDPQVGQPSGPPSRQDQSNGLASHPTAQPRMWWWRAKWGLASSHAAVP